MTELFVGPQQSRCHRTRVRKTILRRLVPCALYNKQISTYCV